MLNIDGRGIVLQEVRRLKNYGQWQGEVLKHIRFKPDRPAIETELTAHYMDHVADLERIGYEPELARERALAAMGDAEEVGRGLDLPSGDPPGRRNVMKLNRKQKTLRNFLLAAALLLLWWVLTGMNPITPVQALRWQAQEWGLKETPRVVCRVKDL